MSRLGRRGVLHQGGQAQEALTRAGALACPRSHSHSLERCRAWEDEACCVRVARPKNEAPRNPLTNTGFWSLLNSWHAYGLTACTPVTRSDPQTSVPLSPLIVTASLCPEAQQVVGVVRVQGRYLARDQLLTPPLPFIIRCPPLTVFLYRPKHDTNGLQWM